MSRRDLSMAAKKLLLYERWELVRLGLTFMHHVGFLSQKVRFTTLALHRVCVHFIGAKAYQDELEALVFLFGALSQILSDLDEVDQLRLAVGVRVLRFELEDLHLVLGVTEAELILQLYFDFFFALFDHLVGRCEQRYVVERELNQLLFLSVARVARLLAVCIRLVRCSSGPSAPAMVVNQEHGAAVVGWLDRACARLRPAVDHEGHFGVGFTAPPCSRTILVVYRLPYTLAQFDVDLVNLEIARQRVVNVRVVHVDRVQVRLHLEQVEGDHLAAENLRCLVLEEPLLVVLLSVKQLVHFVLLSLDLVCDLLVVLEDHFFGRLGAHIDRKKLLSARLDAEQVSLLESLALAVESRRPCYLSGHLRVPVFVS